MRVISVLPATAEYRGAFSAEFRKKSDVLAAGGTIESGTAQVSGARFQAKSGTVTPSNELTWKDIKGQVFTGLLEQSRQGQLTTEGGAHYGFPMAADTMSTAIRTVTAFETSRVPEVGQVAPGGMKSQQVLPEKMTLGQVLMLAQELAGDTSKTTRVKDPAYRRISLESLNDQVTKGATRFSSVGNLNHREP